jgi:hypothetical protein
MPSQPVPDASQPTQSSASALPVSRPKRRHAYTTVGVGIIKLSVVITNISYF